jgi:hypothetical protein
MAAARVTRVPRPRHAVDLDKVRACLAAGMTFAQVGRMQGMTGVAVHKRLYPFGVKVAKLRGNRQHIERRGRKLARRGVTVGEWG